MKIKVFICLMFSLDHEMSFLKESLLSLKKVGAYFTR